MDFFPLPTRCEAAHYNPCNEFMARGEENHAPAAGLGEAEAQALYSFAGVAERTEALVADFAEGLAPVAALALAPGAAASAHPVAQFLKAEGCALADTHVLSGGGDEPAMPALAPPKGKKDAPRKAHVEAYRTLVAVVRIALGSAAGTYVGSTWDGGEHQRGEAAAGRDGSTSPRPAVLAFMRVRDVKLVGGATLTPRQLQGQLVQAQATGAQWVTSVAESFARRVGRLLASSAWHGGAAAAAPAGPRFQVLAVDFALDADLSVHLRAVAPVRKHKLAPGVQRELDELLAAAAARPASLAEMLYGDPFGRWRLLRSDLSRRGGRHTAGAHAGAGYDPCHEFASLAPTPTRAQAAAANKAQHAKTRRRHVQNRLSHLRGLWMTHLARKKCAMGKSTSKACLRYHNERAMCFKTKKWSQYNCRAYSAQYKFLPNRGYVPKSVAI